MMPKPTTGEWLRVHQALLNGLNEIVARCDTLQHEIQTIAGDASVMRRQIQELQERLVAGGH